MRQLLMLLLYCGICSAQIKKLDGSTITPKQIDRIVEKLLVYGKVEGIGLSVINGNKAFVKSYGIRTKSPRQLLDPISVMPAADFYESVIAYLTLKYVENRMLSLDTPLYQYLNPSADSYWVALLTPNGSKITARHCLSHQSALIELDGTLATLTEPGKQFAYSATGPKLLQAVLEHISGRPLEDLAREQVFEPFGMLRSGFKWQTQWDANRSTGFDTDGKPVQNNSGLFYTTLSDYTRFIQKIMLNQGLDRRMRTEMINAQTPIAWNPADTNQEADKLAAGLGWRLFKSKYGRAFFNQSHDAHWQHYSVNFPDKNIAIVIMTNSANGRSVLKELLFKILADDQTPWQWLGFDPYKYP